MNLLAPLGLLALIGLPLIVIIYILKPKYQEKTINSTYIWRLSLRYRKRKIPLQWLKRSLLLIVQLLIMAVLAFMIAQPFIKHPKPQYERIIILDASASMMAVDENGKTRFDKAKEQILKEAEESSQEYDMSIILCNENPDWLIQNAFSASDDADGGNYEDQKALGVNKINIELSKTKCTNQSCDYAKAIKLADEYRLSNPDAKIILYTDHEFEQAGYVTVENFSSASEWNASILSVEELAGGNETLYFEVTVGSFMKAGEFVLNAEITGINGYEDGPYSRLTFTHTLQFKDNNPKDPIVIRGEKDMPIAGGEVADMRIYSYKEARFYLTTTTGAAINDSYKYDNEYYCFGSANDLFSARVEVDQAANVTTTPYVLSALTNSNNINCTEVSDSMKALAESTKNEDGTPGRYNPPAAVNFDLYVYDGRMPNALPDDGAVWLVNVPTGWGLSSELGITIGAPSEKRTKDNMYNIDISMSYDAGIKETVLVKNLAILKSIGQSIDMEVLVASQYRPITIAQDNPYNFKTVLEINGQPIMIAGEDARGVRVVITSLDLTLSDLSLAGIGTIMAKNVVDYSLSYPLKNLSYGVGETVEIYSKPKVEAATITVEGSEAEPLAFSKEKGEFPISFVATEPGVHVLSQEFSNTSVNKETKFFVHLDKDECNFGKLGGILADNDGSQTAGDALANSDLFDMEDITFWFAAAMMLLLLIEWGLQYREQY